MAPIRPRNNPYFDQWSAAYRAELAALGLKPPATSDQIRAAELRKYGPRGLSGVTIDPDTGLPFTPETARAKGSGQLLGNVVGAAGGGLLLGGMVDNIIAALRGGFGAVSTTEGGIAGAGAGGGAEGGAGSIGATEAGGLGGGAVAPVAGAVGAGVGLVEGLNSTLDFLKWIAWLFHPINLLRAAEFLVGMVLIGYGINTLTHVMRRGRATHRSNVLSVFNFLPWRKFKARRAGRRAGTVQAERDVAYRGARQERARQAGARQRQGPGGGAGGEGGTGTVHRRPTGGTAPA